MRNQKLPGHEVLMRAAMAITQAPLGRIGEGEKRALGQELMLQVTARRDDVIPDVVRQDIVSEVVNACALLTPDMPDEVVSFTLTNVGTEGLKLALSQLNETWVYYSCGDEGCEGHVGTMDHFQGYRRQLAEQKDQIKQVVGGHLPTGLIGILGGATRIRRELDEQLAALPEPEIIFMVGGTSEQPEEASGPEAEEAAAAEAEVTVGVEPGPPAPPDIPEE